MTNDMISAVDDIKEIVAYRVEGSILPARVVALRPDGSTISTGDKFLNQAIVKLFFILTEVMCRPNDIGKVLLEVRDRLSYDKSILKVLLNDN